MSLNGLAHTTRFCSLRAVETAFEQAKCDIQFAAVVTVDFSALGRREAIERKALILQVGTHGCVQFLVQSPRKFAEVRQTRGRTPGNARSREEQDLSPRLGEKEILGEFCRVVGDLDQAGI